MAGRRHTPAQIVNLLRRADDMLAHGRGIAVVATELGISQATFHRWRAQYGGIKAGDARRLAELDAENRQLRATVANQTLDLVMLRELVRALGEQLGHRGELVQLLGERFQTSQRRACQVIGEPRTTVRRALTAVDGMARRPQDQPDGAELKRQELSTETFFAELHTGERALG